VRVHVLLFASYADALGASELPLDLAPGATVADALAAVRARPGATRLPPAPLTAVNERWAPADQPLAEGDAVALLPPVAGG
jgi:molybdopterin converting factor small subunit